MLLNGCRSGLMTDCGPMAKDSALCHDEDQVVTALEMESCSVCDSVSPKFIAWVFCRVRKGCIYV